SPLAMPTVRPVDLWMPRYRRGPPGVGRVGARRADYACGFSHLLTAWGDRCVRLRHVSVAAGHGMSMDDGADTREIHATGTPTFPAHPDQEGLAGQVFLRQAAPPAAVFAVFAVIAHYQVAMLRHHRRHGRVGHRRRRHAIGHARNQVGDLAQVLLPDRGTVGQQFLVGRPGVVARERADLVGGDGLAVDHDLAVVHLDRVARQTDHPLDPVLV